MGYAVRIRPGWAGVVSGAVPVASPKKRIAAKLTSSPVNTTRNETTSVNSVRCVGVIDSACSKKEERGAGFDVVAESRLWAILKAAILLRISLFDRLRPTEVLCFDGSLKSGGSTPSVQRRREGVDGLNAVPAMQRRAAAIKASVRVTARQ